MAPTLYLKDPFPDGRDSVECTAVELTGNCAHLEPAEDDDRLVVPMDNVAGIEGTTSEREVEQLPTQGGQYTEVVTRIS